MINVPFPCFLRLSCGNTTECTEPKLASAQLLLFIESKLHNEADVMTARHEHSAQNKWNLSRSLKEVLLIKHLE